VRADARGALPSRKLLLAGLVLAAFALRVAVGVHLGLSAPPLADDLHYDKLARSLTAGEGYTIDGQFISFRPPLYPLFLSLVYRVAGESYAAARIAQAALGALGAWLTFLVGGRLFGQRKGFAAAALYATSPSDVFFSHGLLTESLFLPLLVAMAYGFVRLGEAATASMRSPGTQRIPMGWVLFTGAAMGAAMLTRPVLLLFPPFLALWAWWIYRKPREGPGPGRVRAALLAVSGILLAALAVMGPWLWEVRERTGHWVPVTTGGGVTFWGANNVQVMDREHWGRWVPIGQLPFYDELKTVAWDQVEVDRRAWRLGLQFVASNPDKIPELLLFKLARFWNPVANVRTSWKIVYLATYGLALPWVFAGLVLTWKRDEPVLILHLLVATFVLSALVFWGDARIRSGISPFLWIFAVAALARTADRLRGARGKRP
jgi:4-amino-4-deoxy-L-arabinose transferase-like glycosyltransferase